MVYFADMKLKLSSWLFIHSGMYDEYVVIDEMQVEFLVKLVIWDMCSCSLVALQEKVKLSMEFYQRNFIRR